MLRDVKYIPDIFGLITTQKFMNFKSYLTVDTKYIFDSPIIYSSFVHEIIYFSTGEVKNGQIDDGHSPVFSDALIQSVQIIWEYNFGTAGITVAAYKFVFPNVLLLSFVNATNSEVLFFFYTIFGEIKNEIKFKNAFFLQKNGTNCNSIFFVRTDSVQWSDL